MATKVLNDVPECTKLPPIGESYQFMIPDEATALNVRVPVPHVPAGNVFVIVGAEPIEAITAVLEEEVQIPVDADT